MTYLRTSSRPADRSRRLIAGICVIVGVCIAAVQFFMPQVFPALFASMAQPFWRAEFAAEGSSLRTPDSVLRENEELKLQLSEAELRLQTIAAIEQENAELKTLWGRPTTAEGAGEQGSSASSTDATSTPVSAGSSAAGSLAAGWPGEMSVPGAGQALLAAVLVRPPASPYDELVIDAGQDFGVAAGAKVYAPGRVLIGRVASALPHSSKVVLFSSPGEKYEVLIGPGNAAATAVGRGGGYYEAQLPRDVHVAEGDFVTSPSLNDRPFGIVQSVQSDPAEPFISVLFAPPVNIYQLRWVVVEPAS